MGMEFDKFAVSCEALISPCPYAAATGIHFTVSIEAASAGPVSRVLRALGFRTEKGQVLNAAVTAVPAAQDHSFGSCLKAVHKLQKQGVVLNVSGPSCKTPIFSTLSGKKPGVQPLQELIVPPFSLKISKPKASGLEA